jgi:glutathione synthase/RimK-type ligase-like ATP-grasp enzyme
MRVLLVGASEREEIARLALRLEERGAEALVFDPRASTPRLDATSESIDGVDLARVRAAYVVDLGLPGTRGADGAPSPAALRASQRHLVLWETLVARLAARARVVNPPRTWDLHGLKPFESRRYAQADLPSPRTLATDDPARLTALGAGRGAGWIQKGLVGGYGYTEAFEPPADAARARRELGRVARLVQERVQGENVRAYVAGERVVGAAEIVSGGDGLDSRRGTQRIRRVQLSEAVAGLALSAAGLNGLDFSAVDLMRDERDGSHLLLECNSAPFFVEFERQTGVPVSSALADLLVERRRRGEDGAL